MSTASLPTRNDIQVRRACLLVLVYEYVVPVYEWVKHLLLLFSALLRLQVDLHLLGLELIQ